MPAYCRINNIDFKSIKIQETAAPIQPAALATKKADFIIMFRASNDEVAEQAATKVGVKLSRVFMKDTGLDIYGTSLIVKDEDVKKRSDFFEPMSKGRWRDCAIPAIIKKSRSRFCSSTNPSSIRRSRPCSSKMR
jgi:hypothetical protein